MNYKFKKKNSLNFNTHNLSSGIYFLGVKIEGKKFTKKIIKL